MSLRETVEAYKLTVRDFHALFPLLDPDRRHELLDGRIYVMPIPGTPDMRALRRLERQFLTPRAVRFGVQQPDPQVSADNLGVFVSKGFTLIGVELVGDAATLHGLFGRLVEGMAVGREAVSAVRNQPGMVIQNQATVGGQGFAVDVQFGPGEKSVIHKSLTKGASKALAGPGSNRARRKAAAS